MAQNVNLSFAGIYTAPSDLAGLPPGALEEAINMECRYKNLGESRRGFEEIPDSDIAMTEILRLTNFPVAGSDRLVALTDDGDVLYYEPSAFLVVQDLTYTAVVPGLSGNSITITYTTGGTAGSEVVSVVGSAISVQIQSGVSTATQVRTAVLASAPAIALVSVVISGTASTAQVAAVSAPLEVQWVPIPGFSTGINPVNILAKSRFVRGGQNLYLTTLESVLSLASASGSLMLKAGVPEGLDLEATATSDLSGFFTNNTVLSTTATLATSVNVTNLASTDGIAVDQYVSGTDIDATLVVQDLTYTSVLFGVLGNAITIRYTTGGTAGAEVVSLVGTAITVQIQSGVSTATQVRAAVIASVAASALVSVAISGTAGTAQVAAAATPLAGGLDNTIPSGTKVSSITPEAVVIAQVGTTAAGTSNLSALVSNAGIVAGLIVTGDGLPDGTTVVSISGGGPYTVVLSNNAFQTGTTSIYTFSSPVIVVLSAAALTSGSNSPVSFYSGAQVAYRMLFGRVEEDIDGNTTTRLGAPSSMAIATNTTGYSTNVTVTGTIPKNSSSSLTFVQLYRSEQTSSIDIVPLDQMQLVYERDLIAGDFTARVVTITDETPDSVKGIPLYTGTDREGILQANSPPPSAWDMCLFRDFALYFNTNQPSTLDFTVLSVGAPSGVQIGDIITIATTNGTPITATFTASAAENLPARQFKVFSSGTVSQNIADTAASLIRTINYYETLPVHALLLSSTTDLPGQIALVGDSPIVTFTITASAHTTAYDPTLSTVPSETNYKNNGVFVSKAGELEAVPQSNEYFVGDSSSPIYRGIALRDYVIVLKGDGVYKIVGTSPSNLTVLSFDLTTKIIGPDTAVSLNSGVWMFSNQGVVSISDAGVDAKSVPIDNQFNELVGSHFDNLNQNSFAMSYESDRKYILSVPENSTDDFTSLQFNFNYATHTWTTWERNLKFGFIHSNEGKLYISRADSDNHGVSKERKTGTQFDYADETLEATITSVTSGTQIVVADVSDIEVGDVLQQALDIISPVDSIDSNTNTITTQYSMSWTTGAVDIIKAIPNQVTWKEIFGDNPGFTRQFSEGLIFFKNTQFNEGTMSFVTDFSQTTNSSLITGTLFGQWGLFPWGTGPWGGGPGLAKAIRYYVPASKQFSSYIVPTLAVRQAYANFKLQGISLSFSNISQEVGK